MNSKKTKILVTGSRGFLGTHLVRELKKDKNNMVVEYLRDVCEKLTLRADYDMIYHLAANTDTTFPDDIEMYRNNIVGFLRVLEFAFRENIFKKKTRLIYASSAAVYGAKGRKEEPLNAYGRSKKVIDDIARKYFKKLPIIGLRFFNCYGPGEIKKGKMASMITQWRQQIKKNQNPVIFRGTFKRDFIYVKDVIKSLVEAQKLKSGIYDVGTGKAVDFKRVLDIVIKELGVQVKPKFIKNPHLGKYQVYTKANLAWGFKPEYDVKSGIRDYFDNIVDA